jgi:prolycopene isomerase
MECRYKNIHNGIMSKQSDHIVCVFPSLHDPTLAPNGKDYVFLLMNAPYKSEIFWFREKETIAQELIKKADKIIPNISNFITEKYIATPITFEKYTLNYKGAFRGWASTISQFGADKMPQRTEIENLYLAGHWATTNAGQGGISVAAYSGLNVSRMILYKAKRERITEKV